MRVKIDEKNNSLWLTAALWLALAVLGLLHFGGVGAKWMTLLAGVGVIALLFFGDEKRLWNLPSLLLLGYAVWSWLTVFWAMSGKFHLREGSKLLIAVFFFLRVAMHGRFDRAFARRVMGIIAGLSALYAFLSVEAVSTGLTKTLLARLPAVDAEKIFFNDSRLSGIFGNSNIEASVFAVGVLLSVALVCGAEKKGQRVLWTATLSFCAFAFLLVFSMGAIACFIAAVAVYLIFAGKGRSAALLRMLSAAVPTLVCGFIAFALFNSERSALVLALLLANAGISVLLELTVSARLSAALEKHERLAFAVLLAVVLGACVYAVAAMNVTGPYTFGPELYRSEQLSAGEHTIQVEADGVVSLNIYTQNAVQMMSSGGTDIYNATVEGEASFTVMDKDAKTFFVFSAEPGVTVSRAVIDGTEELPLRYKLLPGFAAYRVQSFGMNNSTMLREMFWGDAVKIWKLSPIVGSGVGAFETGVTAVQDYPYETKYVHQHYLQILLEDGVIGLALYVSALAAMLLALWKKRRAMLEGELRWVYPALCAAFVMNGAQMLWDVSMSMIVFLCMTYALYGLIVGACAEPLAEKAAAEESGGKKKKAQVKRPSPSLLTRNFGIGFTAVVVLTLCGNLYAGAKAKAPVTDNDEFLFNLRSAAKLDLYERNDKLLSYVMVSLEDEAQSHRAQADEYAAQLAKVQSNTIPRYLVSYYVQTEQYDKAIDEAILGATYSASNAETWNGCCMILYYGLIDTDESPLLTQREILMPRLAAYAEALRTHNENALVPVAVDETAQAFFEKIAALEACGNDAASFAETLLANE